MLSAVIDFILCVNTQKKSIHKTGKEERSKPYRLSSGDISILLQEEAEEFLAELHKDPEREEELRESFRLLDRWE